MRPFCRGLTTWARPRFWAPPVALGQPALDTRLTSCSAFGGTPDEALAEVLKAKRAWLKAARAAKKPIPKPSFRPAIYQVA